MGTHNASNNASFLISRPTQDQPSRNSLSFEIKVDENLKHPYRRILERIRETSDRFFEKKKNKLKEKNELSFDILP